MITNSKYSSCLGSSLNQALSHRISETYEVLTSKAEMKPRSYQRACLGYPQLISVCKIFLFSNRPQNRSAENMLMSHFKYTFKSVHHYHPLDALTSFRITNNCLKLNIKIRAREKWCRMGPKIVFSFFVAFCYSCRVTHFQFTVILSTKRTVRKLANSSRES